MSSKKMIVAFGAGAACMGTLAFAIAAGPEDQLKQAADKYVTQGTQMVQEAVGQEPEMSPEAMAEMEAWMKLGEPGEQHAHLAKSVGEWDVAAEFEMEPGAPWTKSTGTMVTKPVFDGRYFKSHMNIDMMGMPMEGFALIGYDNGRGEFHSTWIDSMSTAIYHSKGGMSSDGSKLIMIGMNYMPDVGEVPMKMVTEWVSDDKIVDHFYNQIDGEWMDHGRITYTRKGHADAGG